ncbi:HET-domain-containing protein, partial [Bimuria novae-zelandiae CBS 107.79]
EGKSCRCVVTNNRSLSEHFETGHPLYAEEVYESVSRWIRHCLRMHSENCSPNPMWQDFELHCIDCEALEVIALPMGAQYLALSYVWGASTVSENCGSLANAPAVVKDSIVVTLSLSLRFLWVDRYFIDQKNAAERHRQIANMGSIYASAILTIIAAGGPHADVGLPGVSSCQCDKNTDFQLGPYSFRRTFSQPGDAVKETKWSTRGWTY